MNKIIVLMIAICLIYASFLPAQNQEVYKEYNFDTEVLSVDDWNETLNDSKVNTKYALMCLAAPKAIEEIIDNSFIIVRCRIDDIERQASNGMEGSLGAWFDYNVTITEFLKGNILEDAISFSTVEALSFCKGQSIFEIGEEYILFIKKRRSIFRGDSYEVDSLMFVLDEEKITKQYQHGKTYTDNLFLTIDDFKLFLEMNTRNTENNGEAYGCDYTESDDIKKIVNFSEVIIRANIEEVSSSNEKYGVSAVKISLVYVYKGEVSKLGKLTLFSNDVRIGEEAIILLSKEPYSNNQGYKHCISSYNSIIYEDDARYNEYLSYIALEKFINKDHLVEMDIPAYLTCDVKDYNKCSAVKNASGDCYLDILYSWEFIWENAQGGSKTSFNYHKDYTKKSKKMQLSKDGSGWFEENDKYTQFKWKYVLLNDELRGIQIYGEDVKKQRLIFTKFDDEGFVFEHSYLEGSDRDSGFDFIREVKLKKASHHIKVITDDFTYIPEGRPIYSQVDGLCADMIPFYMEGADFYPLYLDTTDFDVIVVDNDSPRMSYDIYTNNYGLISNGSEAIEMPEKQGKYIVGIQTVWKYTDDYYGYQFLIGLTSK